MRKIIFLLVLAFTSCVKTTSDKNPNASVPQLDFNDTSTVSIKDDISLNEVRYVNTASNLNYRDIPNGKVLGKFKRNDQVTIVHHSDIFTEIIDEGEHIKGEWVGVLRNRDTVYVFDGFLSKTKLFKGVWSKFPIRKIPFVDTTNFDNIDKSNRLSKNEINQLQLEELYPEVHKYEFEVYPSYQLDYGDYKSIVVNIFKGDHELESVLIIYDSDDTLIKIYQGDDNKPSINSLVIAYDEIAEGWSRKTAQFKYDCITTIDALYTDTPVIDTILYHINNQGIVNEVNTDFKNNIRYNKPIKLHTTYIDTIQFVNYNDDYDYFFIEGKKDNRDVSLIYNWDLEKKYNFKENDYIKVQWQMDSITIAGDGETLFFSEYAIDAEKIKE